MMLVSKNSDLTGLDIVKFLMAFAVIAIHCRHEGLVGASEWPLGIEWIVKMAVPFFFIASGFLLARRFDGVDIPTDEQRNVLRRRALTLFRIFGFWLLIYLPIAIYVYVGDGTIWWKAVAGYVYKVLTGGHSLWAWQLWFIYSMAFVFLLYSITLLSKHTVIALFVFFIMLSFINSAFVQYGIQSLKWVYVLTHSTLGGGRMFDGWHTVLSFSETNQ